jgi:ligand-binding SRPBCC domain-containing protein
MSVRARTGFVSSRVRPIEQVSMRFSRHVARSSRYLAADIRAPHAVERLDRDIIVPASLGETFTFFADAANLQRITPPWLHFSILTAMPVRMEVGLEIAYRIRVYGLPMPWRSRIDVCQPGACFVDRQIVGPYRWWRHEHRFEAVRDGTRVIDHVEYAPRAGWLSAALVRRDLGRIFDYRQEALRRIFQAPAPRATTDVEERARRADNDLPCGISKSGSGAA